MGSNGPNSTDRARQSHSFPLELPLFRFTKHDWLSLRDAFEGIHIFGGLGSGKTSGSGQTIAHSFLRSGFGGLVLTAKPRETETWKRYAAETGREIILIGPDHDRRFNFIDYELRRPGRGTGIASNLVSLFEEVLEVHAPGKVLGGDPYWREARGQLLRNAIELVRLVIHLHAKPAIVRLERPPSAEQCFKECLGRRVAQPVQRDGCARSVEPWSIVWRGGSEGDFSHETFSKKRAARTPPV